MHGTDGLVYTDKEKANTLASNFEKVHHLTENMGREDIKTMVNDTCRRIDGEIIDLESINYTSPKEIRAAIKKTRPKKAPGPDGIQNIILKHLPKKAIV